MPTGSQAGSLRKRLHARKTRWVGASGGCGFGACVWQRESHVNLSNSCRSILEEMTDSRIDVVRRETTTAYCQSFQSRFSTRPNSYSRLHAVDIWKSDTQTYITPEARIDYGEAQIACDRSRKFALDNGGSPGRRQHVLVAESCLCSIFAQGEEQRLLDHEGLPALGDKHTFGCTWSHLFRCLALNRIPHNCATVQLCNWATGQLGNWATGQLCNSPNERSTKKEGRATAPRASNNQ
jgi:hypothetical protein